MRIDEHSPSRIVPANYTYVCSYSTGAEYYSALNLDIVNVATVVATDAGHKTYGTAGKCGVCGARYRYGDLWRHMSGELVHVGHDCADKYRLLANRTEWQLAHEREMAKMQRQKLVLKRAEQELALYAANPGLERAVMLDHRITIDIMARFVQYGSISPKQIALLLKLQADADRRANPTVVMDGPQRAIEQVAAVDYANDGFPF